MTNPEGAIEFLVLGPLEVRLGRESLALSGAKQRAVLAVLLLREGEVVSVERLVDEVWGDEPPRSAVHSLESYVSRLRQVFNGRGPTLVRRGSGYVLQLHGAVLDSQTFRELLDAASGAADARDPRRVVELTTAALAVWRGPALADVALASSGGAGAEHLEELRLRVWELRFDAELDLGRHEAIVGDLRVLVGQNPYRERLVAQLMLAYYRSGRQAEALDVYEQTRRRLDADLGLQPSAELRQLSGQIVRQEPGLRGVRSESRPDGLPRTVTHKGRKVWELVSVGALAAATVALTASGGAASSSANRGQAVPAERATRVALVVPQVSRYPELVPWNGASFRAQGAAWGFDTRVMVDSGSGLRNRIRGGDFDLVLVAGRAPTEELSPVARELAPTKLVFLDASLADLSLEGAPNVSTVRFADEQQSELAGYLSALVPRRRGSPSDRVDMVSVVAGPNSPHARRVVAGFRHGVARVRKRRVAVRVDYLDDANLAACERVANDQIDAGSDVVFADAGRCGLGALAVARTRGVWGIGWYEDGVDLGPHILAVAYKDYEHAIRDSLSAFARGRLRAGEEVVLGLKDNYAVGIEDKDRNAAVPDWIWSRVVDLCSNIRQQMAAGA